MRSDSARAWGNFIYRLGWRTAKSAVEDNLPHWAAAISYYSVMSFAPMVFLGISITAFFVDAEWTAERLTTIFSNFLPEGSNWTSDLVDSALNARGQVSLVSAIAFLYTGSRVFAALARGLNVVYDLDDQKNFLREIAVQFIMLFTIGMAFIAALGSGFFFGLIWDAVQILPGDQGNLIRRIVIGGIQIVALFVAYFLIYRFVPRGKRSNDSAMLGAVAATILFVIVRPLFIFYINRFGEQDVVYGPLATLVVLLIWVWIASLIILIGAEIAVNFREVRSDTLGDGDA